MKKIFLIILLLAGLAFGQSQIVSTFTFQVDSVSFSLVDTDTVYLWFTMPTRATNVDSVEFYSNDDDSTLPAHMDPPPEGGTSRWWYNLNFGVIMDTVTADTESDSIQISIQPADKYGRVSANDVRYFDFDSDANLSKTVKTLNWAPEVLYTASSSGELVPCPLYRIRIIQKAAGAGQSATGKAFVTKN